MNLRQPLPDGRGSQRGVTLIELLIAITLVATLSVGMLMAMRTSLITLEKTDARLQANRRSMSVQQILARQIGGVIPVPSVCGGAVFKGSVQNLRMVSSYSLAEGSRGYPRILEFQVIAADSGGVRLIVNEIPYTGPSSIMPGCAEPQGRPLQSGPGSFIMADHLAYCRFWYHERIPQSITEGKWTPEWTGVNLPSAVRVEMAPLIVDPAHLPLLGVTVPIHINKDVIGQYADQQ
jgi:prepilin-type N-terminal cleavage/methylation domain-containing protein